MVKQPPQDGTSPRHPSARSPGADTVEQGVEQRLIQWIRDHQRAATAIGIAVLITIAGVWFTISARDRKEAFAARDLAGARSAVDAGNLPLAVNDLSRLVRRYDGTSSAREATILLARVRLLQGQPDSAVNTLQAFLEGNGGGRHRAQALQLLAAAHEANEAFVAAGDAYRRAADAWGYPDLGAQALIRAGNAYSSAGDTTQAVLMYERVLKQAGASDQETPPFADEAQVRLAELKARTPVGRTASPS